MSPPPRIVVSALIVAGAVTLTSLPTAGTPAGTPGEPSAPESAVIPLSNGNAAFAEGDTVTVDGQGAVVVQADRLTLHADLSATAEVGSDALADFVDARRRADESLAGAELPDFYFRQVGPTARYFEGQDPQDMMGGAIFINGNMQTMDANPNVRLQTRYELSIRGLDEVGVQAWEDSMTRALDAAIEAGLTPRQSAGSNPMMAWSGMGDFTPEAQELVEFSSTHYLDKEEEAIREAMGVAQQRAALMAEIAGKKLGPVRNMTLVGLEGRGPWNECQGEIRAHVQVTYALTE